MLSMQVAELLVKKCLREMSGLPELHLPDVDSRVNAAWNVGRKKDTLDARKTFINITRFLGRFSVLSLLLPSEKAVMTRSVAVIDNQFTVLVGMMPFTDVGSNIKAYDFKIEVTKATVSKHALARWMYRNNSEDYKLGLKVLGLALVVEDFHIFELNMKSELVPHGFHERQVPCSDGGVAIIAI